MARRFWGRPRLRSTVSFTYVTGDTRWWWGIHAASHTITSANPAYARIRALVQQFVEGDLVAAAGLADACYRDLHFTASDHTCCEHPGEFAGCVGAPNMHSTLTAYTIADAATEPIDWQDPHHDPLGELPALEQRIRVYAGLQTELAAQQLEAAKRQWATIWRLTLERTAQAEQLHLQAMADADAAVQAKIAAWQADQQALNDRYVREIHALGQITT